MEIMLCGIKAFHGLRIWRKKLASKFVYIVYVKVYTFYLCVMIKLYLIFVCNNLHDGSYYKN